MDDERDHNPDGCQPYAFAYVFVALVALIAWFFW